MSLFCNKGAITTPLVELPAFNLAFRPKTIPLGLVKNKFTFLLSVEIKPLIVEREPPATLDMIFWIFAPL